jgi:hypothetical protein
MRRQRPANTKIHTPTPRHHTRQQAANKPPTRQHPARATPHTPLALARGQEHRPHAANATLRFAYDGKLG